MRYTSDEQRRYVFRDWLKKQLKQLKFYIVRGDRYQVSEFARYAKQLGARVEEVSLGRYLREKDPVLPTPESCRELARALGLHPLSVLMKAGYLVPEDFTLPVGALNSAALRQMWDELERQADEQLTPTEAPSAERQPTTANAPTHATTER